MAELPIHFGILGYADIANKLSRAIMLAPNVTLSAVGSRSLEKAARFAAINGLPPKAKIYGSYEEVLDDPEVEAAYMPLPTSLHLKWAVLAAEKKKHLLVEKPVAVNVAVLDKILEDCDSNGVQFMDGTMFMHHPRTAKMKEFISDPQLFGQLKSVQASFTFLASSGFLENNIRVKPDLDALGALGGVGWYCIRAILFAADYELPKSVRALPGTVLNKAGVSTASVAFLLWEDGKIATFNCSFHSNLTMNVTFIGSKGTLLVEDFVLPFRQESATFSAGSESGFNDLVTGWKAMRSEHVVATDIPQGVVMVREFSDLVAGIKRNGSKPEQKRPVLSGKTQLVVDAVMASIHGGFELVEL